MADMIPTLEGNLNAQGRRFAIVASRFNALVVDRLVAGAVDFLERHGARSQDITLVKVPGAWEIPLATRLLLEKAATPFDAVVCVGAVIRGGTPHFDYVAAEVSKGIAALSLAHDTPIGFGVLTTDTLEQALERAGSKMGNKGAEAAQAALEMMDVALKIAAR